MDDILNLDFSSLTTSVTFDFSEFTDDVENMKKKKEEELQFELQRRIKKVSQPDYPMAPLPSQESASLALHNAVVEAYAQAHQLNPKNKKQEHTSRKYKGKHNKKMQAALDYSDKTSNKFNSDKQRQRRLQQLKK